MSITEIQMYNALKLKLGEKEAQELVEFVKHEVKDEFEVRSSLFATKEDMANLKADILRMMLIQTGVIVTLIVTLLKLL